MHSQKIVVLDGYTLNPGDLDWAGITRLGNCTIYDRTTPEETLKRAANAQMVFTNKTVLNNEVLSRLSSLNYIGVLATGYNVIDIEQAKAQNITVTNTPGYGAPAVAQAVFSMILHFTNQLTLHSQSVKKGDWAASKDFCYQLSPLIELNNKTMGIIGYGSIGKQVAAIAHAFGMNVIVNTRSKPKKECEHIKFASFEEVLQSSDFISLHCPLTESNQRMINAQTLKLMKTNCILINTARGPLIDEEDLAYALVTNQIGGAALDVLTMEPPKTNHPLYSVQNCIITPHIAWATREARQRLLDIAVNNAENFLKGTPTNVIV